MSTSLCATRTRKSIADLPPVETKPVSDPSVARTAAVAKETLSKERWWEFQSHTPLSPKGTPAGHDIESRIIWRAKKGQSVAGVKVCYGFSCPRPADLPDYKPAPDELYAYLYVINWKNKSRPQQFQGVHMNHEIKSAGIYSFKEVVKEAKSAPPAKRVKTDN